MMRRLLYTTVSGEVREYEYAPWDRPTAADRCRRSLCHAGELIRVGKARWRAGARGRRFNDCTVRELLRSGAAILEGDKVRLT